MAFFTNRVVLITGAGNGLGRRLAVILAGEGASVAGIDLQAEPLAELAAELSGKSFAWATADVTDRVALNRAVAQLSSQLGPVDLLIANAGIGIENSGVNFSAETFEAQVRVNLIGVANSVAAVLPGMIERRRGHLVGMSSLASYRGLPRMLGYCASKSGLNALLEGLRAELQPFGITVTTICPGWIRTALTANVALPSSQVMELPQAAQRIVTAIRQRRTFYAFPPAIAWQVRLLHWLPGGLSDRLTRRASRAVHGHLGGT